MRKQPLSPDKRNTYVRTLQGFEYEHGHRAAIQRDAEKTMLHEALEDLLADSAYWREAVKNAAVTDQGGPCLDGLCPFCLVMRYDGVESHKDDCPYIKSHE